MTTPLPSTAIDLDHSSTEPSSAALSPTPSSESPTPATQSTPHKRRSERRVRTHLLQVRLTTSELNDVRIRAGMCGVSTASFVRAVALGEKLKVVADQRAVLELIRLRADMGRLGGLLKLWLTNEERFDKERGELSVADVRDVLHRIEATEEQIREVVERL